MYILYIYSDISYVKFQVKLSINDHSTHNNEQFGVFLLKSSKYSPFYRYTALDFPVLSIGAIFLWI